MTPAFELLVASDHRYQCCSRSGLHAGQAHQLLCSRGLLGDLFDVPVILSNPIVKTAQLAEQSPITVFVQPGRSSNCAIASRWTVCTFNGSTIPNSDSKPRMRLIVAMRCATKPCEAPGIDHFAGPGGLRQEKLQSLHSGHLGLHERLSAHQRRQRIGPVAWQQQSEQIGAKAMVLRQCLEQRIELHRKSPQGVWVQENTKEEQT